MHQTPIEVLDVLCAYEPDTSQRLPVRRDDAIDEFRSRGQRRAAAIVADLPHRGGVIDADAIDSAVLAVHCELSRLSQSLRLPQLMAAVLAPLVDSLRAGPVRIVDVGCGIGFDLRALAASTALGAGVEYWGLDMDPQLIECARRLASAESTPVAFVRGDALTPHDCIDRPEQTILISSSLLHHLEGQLPEFFAMHARIGVAGFAHFDVSPGWWSRAGGWVLHRVRMRESISRHDGGLSMVRARTAVDLLDVATAAVGGAYALNCDDASGWLPLPHRAVRPIVGLAP